MPLDGPRELGQVLVASGEGRTDELSLLSGSCLLAGERGEKKGERRGRKPLVEGKLLLEGKPFERRLLPGRRLPLCGKTLPLWGNGKKRINLLPHPHTTN